MERKQTKDILETGVRLDQPVCFVPATSVVDAIIKNVDMAQKKITIQITVDSKLILAKGGA